MTALTLTVVAAAIAAVAATQRGVCARSVWPLVAAGVAIAVRLLTMTWAEAGDRRTVAIVTFGPTQQRVDRARQAVAAELASTNRTTQSYRFGSLADAVGLLQNRDVIVVGSVGRIPWDDALFDAMPSPGERPRKVSIVLVENAAAGSEVGLEPVAWPKAILPSDRVSLPFATVGEPGGWTSGVRVQVRDSRAGSEVQTLESPERTTTKASADSLATITFRLPKEFAEKEEIFVRLVGGDNLTTPWRAIRIVQRPLRCLVVAGAASPEFVALRDWLSRQPDIEAAIWPLPKPMPSGSDIERYDAVVLLEPNPLDADRSTALRSFVSDGGGLLAVEPLSWSLSMATHDMPATDPLGEALRPVMPAKVVADDGGAQRVFATATGRQLGFLPNDASLHWDETASRLVARPTATVLAEASQAADGSRRREPTTNVAGSRPAKAVLVEHRVGSGLIAMLSDPSTYRWRASDQAAYDQFWRQVLNRLGRSRQTGSSAKPVLYRIGPQPFAGDVVRFAQDGLSGGQPSFNPSELRISVTDPAGNTSQIASNDDDTFAFLADEPGRWRVRVRGAVGDRLLHEHAVDVRTRPVDRNFIAKLATRLGQEAGVVTDLQDLDRLRGSLGSEPPTSSRPAKSGFLLDLLVIGTLLFAFGLLPLRVAAEADRSEAER